MANIFGNLLDLVDYIYSPEAIKRNLCEVIDVKIERLRGLDGLVCSTTGNYPYVSTSGDNLSFLFTYNKPMAANLQWLKTKQPDLNSFMETGRVEFLRSCFIGMYVKEMTVPLRYNAELDCYEIAFYTYTEGAVIKRRTREKVTILISLHEEETKRVVEEVVEEKEVKDMFDDKSDTNSEAINAWDEFSDLF